MWSAERAAREGRAAGAATRNTLCRPDPDAIGKVVDGLRRYDIVATAPD